MIVIIDLKMCYLAMKSWTRLSGATLILNQWMWCSPAQVLKGSTITIIHTDFKYRIIFTPRKATSETNSTW